MTEDTKPVKNALAAIQSISDEWCLAAAPNAPIDGLDYDALTKHIKSIPVLLKGSQEKDLIGLAHDIAANLPNLEFQDSIANREAIIIKNRILVMKDTINNMTRIARRQGYFDPESQVLNVSGPEAAELRQTLLKELSGVKTAIDEIKIGLAKKNVDPGISIGIPGVSVNLSKALSFISDQTEDARFFVANSSRINIASLRTRLKDIAGKSALVSSFIKDKIKVFGSKLVAAAEKLNLFAHQALSSGLELVKITLELRPPEILPKDHSTVGSKTFAIQYITENIERLLASHDINKSDVSDVSDIRLKQKISKKLSYVSEYWLIMKVVIGPPDRAKFVELEFVLDQKLIGTFAGFSSKVLSEFVKDCIIE